MKANSDEMEAQENIPTLGYVAAVVNSDLASKSGAHWISVVYDLDRHIVYFNDSEYKQNVDASRKFANELISPLKSAGWPVSKVVFSTGIHAQQKHGLNTCGYYAIAAIIATVGGEDIRKSCDQVNRAERDKCVVKKVKIVH